MIDLHLHIDGSLPLNTVRRLAADAAYPLPEDDGELLGQLAAPPHCQSLNEYLRRFELPVSLMQNEEAVMTATRDLCLELKSGGLEYAELRFAPQLHTRLGCSQEAIVLAALEGIKASGFNAGLIVCCMRGRGNEAENLLSVKTAAALRKKGVVAVDLAGAEALFPTRDYKELFEYAYSLGLPFTIHAGEASGAESVREAIAFGASRIGHGVRAIEDKELVKLIVNKGITLEMCLTSNLQTKAAVPESYPLIPFLESGVKVTLNTDNMTVSQTDMVKEFDKARNILGITPCQERQLKENALNSVFS